jgi:hypothetical protein
MVSPSRSSTSSCKPYHLTSRPRHRVLFLLSFNAIATMLTNMFLDRMDTACLNVCWMTSFAALLGSNIYSVAGPEDIYRSGRETWVTPSYYANYVWSLVSRARFQISKLDVISTILTHLLSCHCPALPPPVSLDTAPSHFTSPYRPDPTATRPREPPTDPPPPTRTHVLPIHRTRQTDVRGYRPMEVRPPRSAEPGVRVVMVQAL